MRKLVSFFFCFSIFFISNSQVTLLEEDFEGTTLKLSSSSANGSTSWDLNTNYSVSGSKSDSAVVALDDTLFLETDSFNTTAYIYVAIEFSHICKIDFFDEAKLQYSTDNGTSWTTLTTDDYEGSGSYALNTFSSTSYSEWSANNSSAKPTSSWWKKDKFDISNSAGFTNVRVRFLLIDTDNNGPLGNYGWLLDDIKIIGSTCELGDPLIDLKGTIYQGTIYSSGPFLIQADIKDTSGVEVSKLVYTVNHGLPDTLSMTFNSITQFYEGTIPQAAKKDTIDYTIYAIDSSACKNKGELSEQFIVTENPPPTCSGSSVTSYDYSENFSSFTAGNGRSTVGTLANGWENSTTDSHNWWVYDQATRSRPFTGPSADHSSNDANYMYVESSQSFNNKTAILNTQCYDFTNLFTPKFSFWYHMFGTDLGELHLDIYFGGKWNSDIMPVISGNQGDSWNKREVDLSAYAGNSVKLRFRALTGNGFRSDIAIDDIEITEPIQEDIELASIVSPSLLGCSGSSSESVTIEITNSGLTTEDIIPVAYRVDGGIVQVDTAFVTLMPGGRVNHTFYQTFDMSSAGTYDIDAWVALPTDKTRSNDSVMNYSAVTSTLTSIFPDTTDFDNFDPLNPSNMIDGWLTGINDYWFVETDSTDTKDTGPKSDHTSGNGNYVYMEANSFPAGKTEASVISKCFDIANMNKPEATVYYNMYGSDMGELHFDVYLNGLLIKDIATSIQGDQGIVWKEKKIDLSVYKGTVRLVFRGIVGMGSKSDIAIDDLSIIDKQPVGINSLDNVKTSLFAIYPNPTKDKLNVSSNNFGSKQLIIYNTIGKEVYYNSSNFQNRTVDVSSFKKGVYFLTLISNQGSDTKRFIKK